MFNPALELLVTLPPYGSSGMRDMNGRTYKAPSEAWSPDRLTIYWLDQHRAGFDAHSAIVVLIRVPTHVDGEEERP